MPDLLRAAHALGLTRGEGGATLTRKGGHGRPQVGSPATIQSTTGVPEEARAGQVRGTEAARANGDALAYCEPVRILVRCAVLALALAPAATAAGVDSPAATKRVVHAWSDRLNAYDNAGAARLFTRPAVFVQSAGALRLRTYADIALWHRLLPCAGKIVSISVKGEYATAVFVLANGKHRRCDAPGQKAAAVFRVHHGKIVSWEQIPVPLGPTA